MPTTDELAEVAERQSPMLLRAMRRLARAIANGSVGGRSDAKEELANVLSRIMARADLAGRNDTSAQANVPVRFAADSVLDQIMRQYRAFHGDQLAQDISGEIQDRVRKAFDAGRDTAMAVMQEISDWSVAYSDIVYRNNTASAYAAGSWKQSMDPEIVEVIPAKLFTAVGDSDTRPNHEAADGLIAGVTDAIWNVFAPPIGHRCRCSAINVDRFELEDRNLINADGSVIRVTPSTFANAYPDPGWGTGRPDRRFYAA